MNTKVPVLKPSKFLHFRAFAHDQMVSCGSTGLVCSSSFLGLISQNIMVSLALSRDKFNLFALNIMVLSKKGSLQLQ